MKRIFIGNNLQEHRKKFHGIKLVDAAKDNTDLSNEPETFSFRVLQSRNSTIQPVKDQTRYVAKERKKRGYGEKNKKKEKDKDGGRKYLKLNIYPVETLLPLSAETVQPLVYSTHSATKTGDSGKEAESPWRSTKGWSKVDRK